MTAGRFEEQLIRFCQRCTFTRQQLQGLERHAKVARLPARDVERMMGTVSWLKAELIELERLAAIRQANEVLLAREAKRKVRA